MEDLPVGASPSPVPGRSAFPGPTDTLEDADDDDDLEFEVGVAHGGDVICCEWRYWLQGSEQEEDDQDEAEEDPGETHIRRSTMTKMLRRRHRTKKEKLPKVSFKELLKLNKPDWPLVLIGIVCSAVIGCLFPLMAILFSDVLRVSLLVTYWKVTLIMHNSAI